MNRRDLFTAYIPSWLVAAGAFSRTAEAQIYNSAPGKLPALAYTTKNVTGTITAPNSTAAYRMQGLNAAFTPSSTGLSKAIICGTIVAVTTGTTTHGINYQLFAGTGSAPTGNQAIPASASGFGVIQTYRNGMSMTASATFKPFSVCAMVTGLVSGTAYWFDLAAEAITSASNISLSNVNISVREIQ